MSSRTATEIREHQAIQLPIPAMELLLCRRDVFEDWNFDHSITPMPYWRSYRVYNTSGSCRFGDKEIPMRPDELMLIAPQTEFDGCASAPLDKFYILFTIKGEYGHIQGQYFTLRNVPGLLELSDAISRKLFEQERSDDLALMCCSLIARALLAIPKEQILYHEEVNSAMMKIYQRIVQNPQADFSNEELARMAGMSRSVFCKKFADCFGLSPRKCIMEQRLNHAIILLLQSELSISEIAAGGGFCDRYHFSRTFQKYRRMTPVQFRRRNRTVGPENWSSRS